MRTAAIACWVALALSRLPAALAQHVHELGYVATLTGAGALPPNASPAVGSARLLVDFGLFTMRVRVEFSGLTGDATAARIHGMTALPGLGVADPVSQAPTLPGFPTGVRAGVYDQTLDLTQASSYDPAFLASYGTISLASNALFAGLSAGQTYFSLKSAAFADGEIQGFLLPTPKPDFDFDGVVDALDLDVWREAYAIEHFGDASGDGFTDGADFLLWQRELGAVASLPGGHHHHGPVPEPTAWLLGAIGGVLGIVAQRRPTESWPPIGRRRSNAQIYSPENADKTVARPKLRGHDNGA